MAFNQTIKQNAIKRTSACAAASCVVSIHDVCPATLPRVRAMVEDLKQRGVGVCSLLVVPEYHYGEKSAENTEFCEWLHERIALGDEVVLHGYYHKRLGERGARNQCRLEASSLLSMPLSALRNCLQELVATVYTASEGEFYDIDEVAAKELLERGLEELARAGIKPQGFIAPAWLMASGVWSALKELPFGYTTTIGAVWDLQCKHKYLSRSLVYSVRSAWRRIVSLGWNEMLLHREKQRPLIRIGLHPPDWAHDTIRKHALTCIERAMRGRLAMTYQAWVRAQRERILE